MNHNALPSKPIGDLTITAISDGHLAARLELLNDIDPADAAEMQTKAHIADPAAIHINGYLVRGNDHTVLIDAGAGCLKNNCGQLRDNLALLGVQPDDIDAILLTHAHPDHVGGLLDADGKAVFRHAELVVNQQEQAFWQDDGHLSQANEHARGNFRVARAVFDQYRDQTRLFSPCEQLVLPHISAIPLPGHTAGHSGYRIESKNDNVLIWGDIVHFPMIQVARPDVSIAFDLDPTLAEKTRRALLDSASADRLLIAGMHLSEQGFAHIERCGGDYRIDYDVP